MHGLIEEKYAEIKNELENYNKTQKQNFKGLESIIEVADSLVYKARASSD